jgi:hypothetical protein
MRGFVGGLEAAAMRLSEEARTGLINSKFIRVGWYVVTFADGVADELLAEEAVRQTSRGLVLTNRGMNLRAMAARLERRQRISSAIAPERRN